MTSMSLIGVVDCNNFFVSCERLFRPDLQKKPVAVLSSNDGCIVARSQEVKDMGIPMGVPYFKVKDIVKDNSITLFSSHFSLYRDVSRRVFITLREELDIVEQYSVDEAFFVVPDDSDPIILANKVKSEIENKVGVPVSVGIATSKTKAKYAVEMAKKTNGVTVLTEEMWEDLIPDIPLSALWGVGRRSYLQYQNAGYYTVADLIKADISRIKSMFGVVGERLFTELQTGSAYKVAPKITDQKSIMSSRSFKETITDLLVLEDALAYHARHIASDLRKQKLLTSVVRVSIQAGKYSDFFMQGASLEAVLDIPTNDTFVLLGVTQNLLNKAYKTGVPYKKVGVTAGHLVSSAVTQETLFASKKGSNSVLLSLIDTLNSKADKELITIGERRRGEKWQVKKDLISPSYTTKWTDVAIVTA